MRAVLLLSLLVAGCASPPRSIGVGEGAIPIEAPPVTAVWVPAHANVVISPGSWQFVAPAVHTVGHHLLPPPPSAPMPKNQHCAK